MANQALNPAMNLSSIETLTGTNFQKWKGDLEIALGFLDYDMALREEAPAVPMESASAEEKSYYAKWKKANRMTILIMLKSMSPSVRGGIEVKDNAKDFLESIALKYKESEKAEISSLMNQLIELKYAGNECVRMHILKVINIGMKLRAFNISVDDNMLVHFALNSLPVDFKQLKSTYVAQKETWSLDELIAIVVQEEQAKFLLAIRYCMNKVHESWLFEISVIS